MTPELTTLLSVALVAGAAWDFARRVLAGHRVKEHAAMLKHINESCDRVSNALFSKLLAKEDFAAHEREQLELMVDWRKAIDEIRARLDHVTQEAKSEVAGTLAAAEMGRSKWR